jgi:hypothetical protein
VTAFADAVRLRDFGERRKVYATESEKRLASISSPVSPSAWTARLASDPLLNVTPCSERLSNSSRSVLGGCETVVADVLSRRRLTCASHGAPPGA